MLNGPRTWPNTFSTPSTTPWYSAATSDLPVMGATLGMMTNSFLCSEENLAMQTLLCHSVIGNALSSEKSAMDHCELRRKCALFSLCLVCVLLRCLTSQHRSILS